MQEVNRKVQGSSTRVSVKGHDPSKGDILRVFRVLDRAEYDEAMTGWNTTRWMNDKREGVLEERTDYVKVR